MPTGTTTRHARFVTTVVIIAIESSPPALRVQTDADASVQGTIAATNSPPKRNSGNNHAAGKHNNGTAITFIPIASNDGNGRATLRRIVSARNVIPIAHITEKTIPLRRIVCFNSGSSGPANTYPDAKQQPKAIRNQCLVRLAHMSQSFQTTYR
jgi:hypothetical protein